MSKEVKRFYRSDEDVQIAGVCGGIAEYIEVDPVFVRAAYVFVTIITGVIPGIIAYFVLAVITPKKSEVVKSGKKTRKA